jgi:hypothetical protein
MMRRAALLTTVLAAWLIAVPAARADNLVFLHHSVGQNWLDSGLNDILLAKTYVTERNDITYGTTMAPDADRPASLGSVPGDSTDMNHWILWFNDYLDGVKTYDCSAGVNRIVMFKSCFPNSDIADDGTDPGDPFSGDKTLANYKAVYRHPAGPGYTYSQAGYTYRSLEDVFAAEAGTLFVAVTAPPQCYQDQRSNANAHRARLFNNWLKNEWLAGYNAAHPGLHNVAVFDLFDVLAWPDNDRYHPNRLRGEFGGGSGDSHPNSNANQQMTRVFATNAGNFLDSTWLAFHHPAGDCDGDGCVGIVDVLIVVSAFGSLAGDPAYQARADITGDGTVDMDDLLEVARNFGT